jgi:hypothetical protein
LDVREKITLQINETKFGKHEDSPDMTLGVLGCDAVGAEEFAASIVSVKDYIKSYLRIH